MTSAIDATKPVEGAATTQSVRDNFAAAKAEIEALQAVPPGGPTAPYPDWDNSVDIASNGGQYGGSLTDYEYTVPSHGTVIVWASGNAAPGNTYTGFMRVTNVDVGGSMNTGVIAGAAWMNTDHPYQSINAPVKAGQHIKINGNVALTVSSGSQYGYGFTAAFVPWGL